MRYPWTTAAMIAACLGSVAAAETTLDWPVGEYQAHDLDSGVQHGPALRQTRTVFTGKVTVEGAAWLRLYFDPPVLSPGSFVRLTSAFDGQVQILDAADLAMWGDSSAYFNGDTVTVQLVAAPGGGANQIAVDEVAFESGVAVPRDTCGICNGDDRYLSDEDFAGRLLPAGCSATVWNDESCLVSAGHCMASNDVIQFRVPVSNPDCSINHPPVNDQFPVIARQYVNGGPGNDWAVMTSGTNGIGQKAYDRFGELRPITAVAHWPGEALEVWGYGVDDGECERSQAQQHSPYGFLREAQVYKYYSDVDITFGNSGSSVLHDGEIVGIATHCGCPNNTIQRTDRASFAAARDALCPPPPVGGPPNNQCSTATLITEGVHAFTTVEATTDGPDESPICETPLNDVWFVIAPPSDGIAIISTCDASFDAALAVYGGDCPGPPGEQRGCGIDGCDTGSGPRVVCDVEASHGYRIRLGSISGATGTGTITISYDSPPACLGDVTGDYQVNADDLLGVFAAWGDSGGPADITGDGTVGTDDFLAVIGNWGPCI